MSKPFSFTHVITLILWVTSLITCFLWLILHSYALPNDLFKLLQALKYILFHFSPLCWSSLSFSSDFDSFVVPPARITLKGYSLQVTQTIFHHGSHDLLYFFPWWQTSSSHTLTLSPLLMVDLAICWIQYGSYKLLLNFPLLYLIAIVFFLHTQFHPSLLQFSNLACLLSSRSMLGIKENYEYCHFLSHRTNALFLHSKIEHHFVWYLILTCCT